ncbi:hypothetical protein CY35_14G006800 [Sphagnum magellanicum]|nr:hypothetical protein CY35_14G006800 [Sphagnum magellanicum]KAH9540469.1 hypothetical protein CY35_14G006800 [Sphagnum magellanicum]
MVDCSAVRWNMVNIVLALIRWRGAAEDGTFLLKEELLAIAVEYGHVKLVQHLIRMPDVNVNTDMVMSLLACDRIDVNKGKPLHCAAAMGHPDVVKELLKSKVDVNAVKWLPLVHVDAANAILVGAALIASVTFAGWLQPPLGYSAFFGSANIEVGAPSPSGIYPSFVSVAGHPIMQIFWFFNSMSFFFAIATLMVGASAARPPKRTIFIGEVVRSLLASLSLAYILLTISVGCVMGAFASAGFLVLPPIPKYMVNMGVTVGIGVTVVFLAWTSSKVLYVLKKIIHEKQTRKVGTNLNDKDLEKVRELSRDD